MKKLSFINDYIKSVIILIITFSCVSKSNAQTEKIQKQSVFGLDNVAMMTSISGNGFGAHYSPLLGVKLTKKIVVSVGPVFKLDKPNYAGYVVSGKLTLLDPKNSFSDKTSLYAILSFENNCNQYFSKNWKEIEVLTSRHTSSEGFDFSQVKFSGYQITTGFALGYFLTDNFSLNSEFGVSVYKSTQLNYQGLRLYHQPIDLVLHLSLVARFNINKD